MIEQGLIENYDDRDFIMSWEMEFLNKINPYQTIWEFNQRNKYIHRSSCSIFSSMWTIMYNTDKKFTQEDVEEYSSKAINDWIVVPWVGAYFNKAVKYIAKQFDLIYYRIDVKSDLFKKWLDNKRAFACWMYFPKEMVIDSQDDWIIQGSDFPKKQGHWIVMIQKEWENYFINSYYWKLKYNRHKIENFEKLVDNGVIFWKAYILLDKKDIMNQIDKDIELVEQAYELWITNNKQNVEDIKKWNYTQDVKTILFVMRARENILNNK